MARPTASLAALLGAAAALLPASSSHAAEAEEADTRASYRFAEYDENALPQASVLGDARRYHVISQESEFDTRLAGGEFGLKLDATHEVMSGSSPWFVQADGRQQPVQVLSGATIRDHRSALSVALTQDPGKPTNTTYSASYSIERDYRAESVGIERSRSIDAALTLGYGGSLSHDEIRPTDALLYGRIAHAIKNTGSVFGSAAWVIDRDQVIQAGIQLNRESGFLSDPYKLFEYGESLRPDHRPGQRAEAAGLVRYRRAFASIDAALHVDYRYAQDSWGLHSHTVDVSWYQSVGAGWRIVPGLRYYSQAAARFYAPFAVDGAGQQFYSNDYRLATFGAISTSLNLRKALGRWEFSLGAERYHSARGLALDGSDAAVPALVGFTRVFAGVDYGFD